MTWTQVGPSMTNHLPGGANVLYMDGHVGYIRYPGAFPCLGRPNAYPDSPEYVRWEDMQRMLTWSGLY